MKRSAGLLLSVAAFVALGMPKAAFGVAWPSAAADLVRPLADLGIVIAVYVIGYFLASAATGALTSRLPPGTVLAAAAGLATVSLVGYAVTPRWGGLLIAAAGLGLGGGAIDAGVNALVAVHHGPRAMGILHAGFGIGATLGPLMLTALVETGTSWRLGFAGLAVFQGVLAVLYFRTRTAWGIPAPDSPRPGEVPVGRRLVLGSALVMFALYSGVEVGAGQWAYTLLSEGRGLTTVAAGGAVTAFWGALTAARLGLGAIGHRVPVHRLLTGCSLLVVVGSLALWLNPVGWAGPAGLVVMGLALGPIFPLQTTLTPQRVGVAFTPAAVGYQLAAATVGAALIPGGLGVLVARAGLEVVGSVLAATSILLMGAIEFVRRIALRAASPGGPDVSPGEAPIVGP